MAHRADRSYRKSYIRQAINQRRKPFQFSGFWTAGPLCTVFAVLLSSPRTLGSMPGKRSSCRARVLSFARATANSCLKNSLRRFKWLASQATQQLNMQHNRHNASGSSFFIRTIGHWANIENSRFAPNSHFFPTMEAGDCGKIALMRDN